MKLHGQTGSAGTVDENYLYLMISHGFLGEVIGCTEPDPCIDCSRGVAIKRWLEDNAMLNPSGFHYLVLDDLDLEISEMGHPLLQTDGKVGLTPANVERAIAMLNGELIDWHKGKAADAARGSDERKTRSA